MSTRFKLPSGLYFCLYCGNLLHMIQVNLKNLNESSLFPEGKKLTCRTCTYQCSIKDAGGESDNSGLSDQDESDDEDGHVDIDSSVTNDIQEKADRDSKFGEYARAVIDEALRRDPGRISKLLSNERYPDQGFQFPDRPHGVYLSKPPLERISEHMLMRILASETQEKRYGEFIRTTQHIEKILIDALTPATQKAFEKHTIELADLIEIGGHPKESENCGVYLHILKTGNHFYLYVGQAYEFNERIAFHNNPIKRRTHLSLHYCIWDKVKTMDGFKSIFVKLAVFQHRPQSQQEQLILNLEETFIASILQTLKAYDLEVWLPDDEDIPRVWAERGLNVALPLWQGYKMEGTESYDEIKITGDEFTEMLHDKDPFRREWAIQLRDSYQSLRQHPDPQIQGIWFANFEKFLNNKPFAIQSAYTANQKGAMDRALDFLARGKTVTIWQSSGGYYYANYTQYKFYLGLPKFELEQYVKVKPERSAATKGKSPSKAQWRPEKLEGKYAFLKPVLFDTPTPLRYASDALPSDAASRLMILADRSGRWCWTIKDSIK